MKCQYQADFGGRRLGHNTHNKIEKYFGRKIQRSEGWFDNFF